MYNFVTLECLFVSEQIELQRMIDLQDIAYVSKPACLLCTFEMLGSKSDFFKPAVMLSKSPRRLKPSGLPQQHLTIVDRREFTFRPQFDSSQLISLQAGAYSVSFLFQGRQQR